MWTLYRVRARLASPFHIGARTLGNVKHTRGYVTGRSFWGALTARLQRDFAIGRDYADAGEQVRGNVAFSYGYFSDSPDGVGLLPWQDPSRFAWELQGSSMGTALALGGSALAGALHETEFIAPRTRSGRPVYLHAAVFVKGNWSPDWHACMPHIQLGAERAYGWGRLAAVETSATGRLSWLSPGLEVASLDGDRPRLTLAKGSGSLAHIAAHPADPDLRGDMEAVVGRETDAEARFGRRLSPVRFAYAPGTIADSSRNFEIDRDGLWCPLLREDVANHP